MNNSLLRLSFDYISGIWWWQSILKLCCRVKPEDYTLMTHGNIKLGIVDRINEFNNTYEKRDKKLYITEKRAESNY